MEIDNNINDNIQNMPAASSSMSILIFKNAPYLLVFLFAPIINWLITIFPDWKNSLENFKLIGGAVIIILVISKLLLEIVKLTKKK